MVGEERNSAKDLGLRLAYHTERDEQVAGASTTSGVRWRSYWTRWCQASVARPLQGATDAAYGHTVGYKILCGPFGVYTATQFCYTS
jgi:hypothetical protein